MVFRLRQPRFQPLPHCLGGHFAAVDAVGDADAAIGVAGDREAGVLGEGGLTELQIEAGTPAATRVAIGRVLQNDTRLIKANLVTETFMAKARISRASRRGSTMLAA